MKKIRVGIVNYLNTRPLLYGLERTSIRDQISLTLDYPANIAAQLKSGAIDLGLVPVALKKEMPGLQRVGSHCIATEGEIASVCLFSQVPIEAIRTIMLDYQSRSSVALLRILMRHYFKRTVSFEPTAGDAYIGQINDHRAGLIIGDRALRYRNDFAYCYDLGIAWKQFTGLPFVFAAWFSSIALSTEFLDAFHAANQWGLDHLPDVLGGISTPVQYDLHHYYTRNVQYHWLPGMQEALDRFLSLSE
ncbi:MAG: menaquinone biosynthetic enzyme MqnA/MqnD family protein [Sphingomonadales bacterium]